MLADILPFRFSKKSRRSSPAPGGLAPEPPLADRPPVEAAAAPPLSAEVVILEDRRLPGVFPWCPPLPPYVCVLILGAAISATAAASIAADLSTMPDRFMAAAFDSWSA